MALIKCKECKSEVSTKAKTCPKCGAKVSAGRFGCGTLIVVLLIGGGIMSALSNNSSNAASSTTAENAANNTPPVIGAQWKYSQESDQMSKGKKYYASVLSSNTVNFEFPYSGEQYATLTLRNDPKYGKDVIFSIEKGQILCHSYEDCVVLVRFDDEKASNYSAVGAADNSTETIFIRNYSRFVEKMSKSKIVRISANIYQEGSPVFSFNVNGFDKNKFKPKN